MRKLLVVGLCFVMITGLVGCGKSGNNKKNSANITDSSISENTNEQKKEEKKLYEHSLQGITFSTDVNEEDCYWDNETRRNIYRMPDYAFISSSWSFSQTDFTNWDSVIKNTEEQLTYDIISSDIGIHFDVKSYEVLEKELITNQNGVEILKTKMGIEYCEFDDTFGKYDEEAEKELQNIEAYVCYFKNNRNKVQIFCFLGDGIESVAHHLSANDTNYTKKLSKNYMKNMENTVNVVVDTLKIIEEK